jgi:hypothetical protein
MIACPNKNTPEWKKLVEVVGEFEAYKDFLETDGLIRDAEEVMKKIQDRSEVPLRIEKETLEEVFLESNPVTPITENNQATNILKSFADNIATRLQVNGQAMPYKFISEEEAFELTKDKLNPWKPGQKAMFLDGTVYFVGLVDKNAVFHEFSHPFVRALSISNSQLFNNLYNKIEQTEEGRLMIEQVKFAYKLDPQSDFFKEEIIVRALSDAALKSEYTPEHKSFLKELLFTIRQFLRKMFGQKVNVSKLDSNTSIEDLTKMLLSDDVFTLEESVLNEVDTVAYLQDLKNFTDDLEKISDPNLKSSIIKAYDNVISQIRLLKDNKNYKDLSVLLADEYNRGELDEMSRNLRKYARDLEEKALNRAEELEYKKEQINAFLNSLFILENIVKKLEVQVKEIAQDKTDEIDNLHRASYIKNILNYWEGFVKEFKQVITETNKTNPIPSNSSLLNLLSSVETSINRSNDYIKDLYKDGISPILLNELNVMKENIDRRYNDQIKKLKDANAKQEIIDIYAKEYYGMTEAEYERMQDIEEIKNLRSLTISERNELELLKLKLQDGAIITKEKIEMALSGELKDLNFFNAFLEGYMYSADPVVGGFALYVKNNMSKMMANAQAKFYEYAEEIQPLLEAAGVNPNNVDQLINKVARKELIGSFDQKGNYVEKEIWTLKSAHKDHRIVIDRLNNEISILENDYYSTKSDDILRNLILKKREKRKLLREFFYQKYTNEVYQREELFEKDEIGLKAREVRDAILQKLRNIRSQATTQEDMLLISNQLKEVWREYRFLFYNVDQYGREKKGEAKLIAERLTEWKNAAIDPETGQSYYEMIPIEGLFENSLKQYELELKSQNLSEDEYNIKRQKWIDENTVVALNDKYWTDRNKVLEELNELYLESGMSPDRASALIDIYREISNITFAYKDSNGQIDGSLISIEDLKKIKKLEKEAQEMRDSFDGLNGLSKIENKELNHIFEKIDKQIPLTAEETSRRNILLQKKKTTLKNRKVNNSGVIKLLITKKLRELNELTTKEPTEYYTDIFNSFLENLGYEQRVDKENAELILADTELIEELKMKDKDFSNWFDMSHRLVEVYEPTTTGNKIKNAYKRTAAWSVIRPASDEYYETINIYDEKGNLSETIKGKPASHFFKSRVKEGNVEITLGPNTGKTKKYVTDKILGITVDNLDSYLPRLDIPNSPFIDQEYLEMQKTDPKYFAILEVMKKHHLKNQQNLPKKSRLYLDIPRFRKDNYEILKTRKAKELGKMATQGNFPFLSLLVERFRDFWRKTPDAAQKGMNAKDDFNLVRADMYDNETATVPIAGLYDIDINDVSTNVNQSLMRYMFSGERQKMLLEMNPVAQALKETLEDPRNKVKDRGEDGLMKINRFNFINKGIISYVNKKGRYTRAQAVNNLIEREFEGKTMADFSKDVPWLNNASSLIMSRASFAFFALNIPSALKNTLGAKFQTLIETAGGENINTSSLVRGEMWAFNAMGKLSWNIYKGTQPLEVQLMDMFDVIRGRAEDKLPQGLSRTIAKDAASLSWLYNFRKWTEQQATAQVFAGMMYKQTVDITDESGSRKIPYIEAFELVDGKLQTKAGVDKDWSISYDSEGNVQLGSRMLAFKNKTQTVVMNLQGAYSQFDQPEANRYLAYRFISYLKKYFTTMLVNRWAFSGGLNQSRGRYNPGMGDIHEGYYVTTIKTIFRILKYGSQYYPLMNDNEKVAYRKLIFELLGVIAMMSVIAPLLGWDPEDPERFEKLRNRSGSLPFFGLTAEDPDHPFNAGGYMMNHLLKLTMDVRAESEAFVPWPRFGMNHYVNTFSDMSSIGFGPTIETYKNMFGLLLDEIEGDPRARYKKSVGAYEWQQEGGSKFITEFSKSLGFTGSTVDPVTSIKNTQSARNR